MELADKLLQLRKARSWTQANAAKQINIQQSYLSKLENGHYIPSTEVIDKLCIAYQVNAVELLPTPQKKGTYSYYKVMAIVMLLFSVGLVLAGSLSLFYPQTFYTYKATPVNAELNEKLVLNFHLTDRYHGESYIKQDASVNYKFELIAQRDISRQENRWLVAMGVMLFLLSLAYLIRKYAN